MKFENKKQNQAFITTNNMVMNGNLQIVMVGCFVFSYDILKALFSETVQHNAARKDRSRSCCPVAVPTNKETAQGLGI